MRFILFRPMAHWEVSITIKTIFGEDFYREWFGFRQQDNSTSRLFESTASFNSDLSPNLNLNILGGYSYQDFTNEGFYAQGGDFLTDAFSFNNLGCCPEFQEW